MNSIVCAMKGYAAGDPDRICLADPKKSYTHKELWEQICRTAAYLETIPVRSGDRVVLVNSQDSAAMVLILALQLLGGVSVPLEKRVAAERVSQIISETEAVCYLSAKDLGAEGPFHSISQAIEGLEAGEKDRERYGQMADSIDPASLAEILYTTGTTGASKGIMLTHQSVVAVCENVISGVEMKPDNVEMIPVPLNHSHGLRRTYSGLLNGSTVVICDGIVFIAKIFSLIEQYHVTAIDLVPAALAALLRLGGDKLGQYQEQMDYIQLGSAPIPENDRRRLMELFPSTRLYNFYGTTESGCSCILDFNDGVERVAGCIGKPTVHSYFAFFSPEGERVEATREEPGLLGCAGLMNMSGYYQAPEKDKEAFRGDYIVTQDLAFMDENGMICLLGRQGDVITSGGNKISPQEVEEVANALEGILESACIPIKDSILGQAPKLFYVPDGSRELSEGEIIEWLDGHLERYKVPKALEKIDKLPRAYNGKLQRNRLHEA